MRNIQKNLVKKWTPETKISDIIKLLPDFCNYYEFLVFSGILPDIGEYYLNWFQYDVNDFAKNTKNKIFKVLINYKNYNEQNEEKDIFLRRFFVVTSINFIIFESVDEKYKNICKINYVGNISDFEKIEDNFFKEGIGNEEYKNLLFLKIRWPKNYSNKMDFTICEDKNNHIISMISTLLKEKRENIKKYFKYIENKESLTIADYKYIIRTKEAFIKKKTNDIIYEKIIALYLKVIEILDCYNDKESKNYLDKMHKFLKDYDKLKDKENNKKEKNSKNNQDQIDKNEKK